MRHVIVGCGRLGATLATALGDEGHDVTVVDRESEAHAREHEAREQHGRQQNELRHHLRLTLSLSHRRDQQSDTQRSE
jgi:Trk K+ transport system NAD-binding subunit